jgi:hypothetical protein
MFLPELLEQPFVFFHDTPLVLVQLDTILVHRVQLELFYILFQGNTLLLAAFEPFRIALQAI